MREGEGEEEAITEVVVGCLKGATAMVGVATEVGGVETGVFQPLELGTVREESYLSEYVNLIF